jgi:hypothetical protein
MKYWRATNIYCCQILLRADKQKPMKKIILSTFYSLVLCFSAQVLAEELKVYIEPTTITQTDHGGKGYSVGDVVTRHGKVFLEEGGPVVGEYFTQAQITHIYNDQKKDARFFVMEIGLPDGEIMTMNFTQIDSGPIAVEGHKHRGVIVGGTGKYSGIKGSYEKFFYYNSTKARIIFNII